MDNTREKLIELLKKSLTASGNVCSDSICKHCRYEKYGDDCGYAIRADYFIENGVTFATDNNVGDKTSSTNADRIRAMSDDMLAEFIILSPEMEFDVCRLCQFGNPTPADDRGQCLSGYGACDAESRAEAFKKWLKQPAETTKENDYAY